MTHRLSLWLAPIMRRVLAPEQTADEFRRELLEGDRGDRLLNGVGTWGTVMVLCTLGFLAFLPLVNISSVCDGISRFFLIAVALTILPIFGYTVAYAIEQRRERNR